MRYYPRKKDPAASAAKQLTETNQKTSYPEAFRRVLRKASLKYIRKKEKPFLSLKHCNFTLDFARNYASWTVEDFKSVVLSDETKMS